MPGPRIYIGSSSEGLDYARAVHAQLRNHAEITVWTDDVFPMGDSTLEALDKAIDRFKFEYAILVLTPDDEREMRGEKHRVPRDNVLMELGLFMGRLGRARTFAVQHRDVELPANMKGITTAFIEKRNDDNKVAAVATACTKVLKAIDHDQGQRKVAAAEPFGQELRGYRNVGESGFVEMTRRLIESSSQLTFVGTGLNILSNGDNSLRIVQRAAAGELKATICFGNPFAPAVRHRLVEEECCAVKPEVAATGIINRVRSLLQAARTVPNLQVKLFNNYPTMAIFCFDNHQFVFYPMGYRKLGNHCPVLFVQKPGALGDFLDEMIQNYLSDAVDAREVFRIKADREQTRQFVSPKDIRALAIYAIPDRSSDFYRHGAELLGYDPFNSRVPARADSKLFRQHVGRAMSYGFHVSASDVMYVDARQIPGIVCELRAIAADARPFEFGIDGIAEGRFGPHSLALECADSSGQFERLLAEITVRIRPMALGTNYNLDAHQVRFWRDLTPRDRVMLEAYHSPYVLGGFQPHFTLATPDQSPPDSVWQTMLATVQERFRRYLNDGARVPINCLYVLQRPVDSRKWDRIRDDDIIRLG